MNKHWKMGLLAAGLVAGIAGCEQQRKAAADTASDTARSAKDTAKDTMSAAENKGAQVGNAAKDTVEQGSQTAQQQAKPDSAYDQGVGGAGGSMRMETESMPPPQQPAQ